MGICSFSFLCIFFDPGVCVTPSLCTVELRLSWDLTKTFITQVSSNDVKAYTGSESTKRWDPGIQDPEEGFRK
jgi:hypothetical protein